MPEVMKMPNARVYTLHSIVRDVKATLDDLDSCSAVLLEVPPMMQPDYERGILHLLTRVKRKCSRIGVIIPPAWYRKVPRSTWLNKWRDSGGEKIMTFHLTCGCQHGQPECHTPYFVGTTSSVKFSHCSHVPTAEPTKEAKERGLAAVAGAVLKSLGTSTETSMLSVASRHHDTVAAGESLPYPLSEDGAQQIPNSSTTRSSEEVDQDANAHTEDIQQITLTAQEATASTKCYPTDAKEREKNKLKAEKAAGIERVVKKRKKIVEDHWDDCGDDMTSLGPDIADEPEAYQVCSGVDHLYSNTK